MKQKIYIETSIPSFYYDEKTAPEAVVRKEWTRKWNVMLGLYIPLLVIPLELLGE